MNPNPSKPLSTSDRSVAVAAALLTSTIDACIACATACDHCVKSNLEETNPSAMADCIELATGCSMICRLAADYMQQGSRLSSIFCEACAAVCDECKEACGTYQMDHSVACADACRYCAVECRALVEGMAVSKHHSPDEVVAGLRQ